TATTFTPDADLAVGSYQAWVRAVTAAGPGPWSAVQSFAIAALDAPLLTGPASETTDTQLTFTWTAVPGAKRYELWLNDLTAGTNPLIHETKLTTLSYTVANPLKRDTYEIWLRSYNSLDQPGSWSPGRIFSIRNLLTPSLNVTGGETATPTPTFS